MADMSLFTLIFTGVWCLVGFVFLGVGIALRRSFYRREARLRARTSGVVTEVVRREDRSSNGVSVSWYPIVDFEVDGHRVSLEGDGTVRKRFYDGQSVEVLYDPDDPSCFRLEGGDASRLTGSIFLAVGLVCVAVGAIVALLVNGLPIQLKHTMR